MSKKRQTREERIIGSALAHVRRVVDHEVRRMPKRVYSPGEQLWDWKQGRFLPDFEAGRIKPKQWEKYNQRMEKLEAQERERRIRHGQT